MIVRLIPHLHYLHLCDFQVLNSLTDDIGAFTYGTSHPMKPHRVRITHDLISAYGMLDQMHVLV
jgi:histone deacetylase 1/2